MTRNNVYVGDKMVVRRYIGDRLIFDDLADKSEKITDTEIFFDNADESVVHVEVDGVSVQDGEPTPDYPIEIHSVNDFDVVSSVVGRNYILNSKQNLTTQSAKEMDLSKDLTIVLIKKYGFTGSIDIEVVNHKILESYRFNRLGFELRIINNNGAGTYYQTDIYPKGEDFKGRISKYFEPRENWAELRHCMVWIQTGGDKVYVGNPKITIGDNTQDVWTPAPEDITEDTNHPLIDKINLSLSEPLRSVGDVKDRLFRDSDGLWKVERNVGESVVDGSEDISTRTHGNGTKSYLIIIDASNTALIDSTTNMTQSSHYIGRSWRDVYHGQDGIAIVSPKNVRVKDDRFSYDNNLFKAWLSEQHAGGNPLTVQYHIEPAVEVLDQELQDKLNNLRSFVDSNYVYAIINDKTDILPTLHAKFKSKGWNDFRKKLGA